MGGVAAAGAGAKIDLASSVLKSGLEAEFELAEVQIKIRPEVEFCLASWNPQDVSWIQWRVIPDTLRDAEAENVDS